MDHIKHFQTLICTGGQSAIQRPFHVAATTRKCRRVKKPHQLFHFPFGRPNRSHFRIVRGRLTHNRDFYRPIGGALGSVNGFTKLRR